MVKEYDFSTNKGQHKMKRYIDDLIRNTLFRRKIKRLRQSREKMPNGNYYTWTKEEKAKSDYWDREYGQIIEGYELLRKRCKRLLRDKHWRLRNSISERYYLDNDQINFIEASITPQYKKLAESGNLISDCNFSMCNILDLHDEELNPASKGDEILYLSPTRQFLINAYPIAICIHSLASKRDVLDFIEKEWKRIDSLRYSEKKLKYGKRKYDQKLLDFIWENRGLKVRKIIQKLEKTFPNNELVYYEINQIIRQEKLKRLSDST